MPEQTGFLLICATGLFIFDKSNVNGYGVCINRYHEYDSHRFSEKLETLGLDLDGCVARFVSKDTIVLVLANGHIWSIKIHPTPRGIPIAISPQKAQGPKTTWTRINTQCAIVTSIASNAQYCFIGAAGNHHLFKLSLSAQQVESFDDDLYRIDTTPNPISPDQESIDLVDTMQSFAPIRSLTSVADREFNQTNIMLAAATGTWHESRITFFHDQLPVTIQHRLGHRLSQVLFTVNPLHCYYAKDDKSFHLSISDKITKVEENPLSLDFNATWITNADYRVALVHPTLHVYDTQFTLLYTLTLPQNMHHIHQFTLQGPYLISKDNNVHHLIHLPSQSISCLLYTSPSPRD